MLQASVLEGVSNGALSPWVERDISPGWKETNWACPEHSHFTARQVCGVVCGCMGGVQCVFSSMFMREGVSTRLCSSTDVVPQHSTGYMYRRTIYLSDLPRALRRTSLSEKPGSLSDPHRLRAEKPGAGIDFHLPAQQTEPGGGARGGEGERKDYFPND